MTRLVEQKVFPRAPDQLLVNEYTPGQGIASHIDHEKHFGDVVCSLSLGSACVMDFQSKADSEQVHMLLPVRGLLALRDDARYQWKHGITKRKSDKLDDGTVLKRGTRISLTFRTMKHIDEHRSEVRINCFIEIRDLVLLSPQSVDAERSHLEASSVRSGLPLS